jgi:hypothetical protein
VADQCGRRCGEPHRRDPALYTLADGDGHTTTR